jgi:phage baseplate assembly protein V
MKELERKINNIVQIGTVTEVKSANGLALARVNLLGRVTDFLPVFLWANDFVKVWMPIRVGQQVAVLSPFGNANSGIILPSVYNKSCKEPSGASDGNVVIDFSGGVRIDSDGVNLNIFAPGFLNIAASSGINIASGGEINIRGSRINLN